MRTRIAILGLCVSLVSACADDAPGNGSSDGMTSTMTESGGATTSTTSMTTAPSTGSTAETTSESSGSTAAGSESTSSTDGMSSSEGTTMADGSSGSSSDEGTTAAMCSGHMEPCPGGKSQCCDGLMCCSGQPIPPGQEYCSSQICPISDRNKKENFEAIDPREVLAKVAALELTTWNYRFEDPAVRHLGPMAQDFKASFGLGATDTSIFTVDADGVALASIQALNAEVETLRAENEALAQRLARLEQRLGTPPE